MGVKFGVAGLLVTLGIVFGDIGTSPLYVMKAIVREDSPLKQILSLGTFLCYLDTHDQTTLKYGSYYAKGRQ